MISTDHPTEPTTPGRSHPHGADQGDDPGILVRYYSAEVEVTYRESSGFSFQVTASDGIDDIGDGDLAVPWLGQHEGARITFRLSPESDASEFIGIRFTEPAAPAGASDLYPGTFFEVTNSYVNHLLKEITITETRNGPPLIQPYFYRYEICVRDDEGNPRSHDPRIYNKGDNGGG